jgi:anaerobic selenocysteine-containing dehydrogenase
LNEDEPSADPMLLRLATIRSHDQYNTTIYSLNDRYRGVFGGRTVVFMNEADMSQRGIAAGALVEIESIAAKDGRRRSLRDFTARPYNIPSGSIAAYYPETNPLLPLCYHDPKSKTPAAKSIPVFVRAQEATDMTAVQE